MRVYGDRTAAQILLSIWLWLCVLAVAIFNLVLLIFADLQQVLVMDVLVAVLYGLPVLVFRKRLRENVERDVAKMAWKRAEADAEEFDANIVDTERYYSVMYSLPLGDAHALHEHIVNVLLADKPTYGEILARLDDAPEQMRKPLHRLFDVTEEEKPW